MSALDVPEGDYILASFELKENAAIRCRRWVLHPPGAVRRDFEGRIDQGDLLALPRAAAGARAVMLARATEPLQWNPGRRRGLRASVGRFFESGGKVRPSYRSKRRMSRRLWRRAAAIRLVPSGLGRLGAWLQLRSNDSVVVAVRRRAELPLLPAFYADLEQIREERPRWRLVTEAILAARRGCGVLSPKRAGARCAADGKRPPTQRIQPRAGCAGSPGRPTNTPHSTLFLSATPWGYTPSVGFGGLLGCHRGRGLRPSASGALSLWCLVQTTSAFGVGGAAICRAAALVTWLRVRRARASR